VTLVLDREVDVSRGSVIAAADNPCETSDQFSVNILWMSEHPMIPSRQYLLQLGTTKALCTPTRIKHKIDISDLSHIPAETLEMNEIAEIHISLDRMIPFMPYDDNREMGGFVLIDRATNETVATGMIRHAMRRSKNIFEHHFTVDAETRAGLKNQKPCVLWFTGLSGSGKSTIANMLEQRLFQRGHHTMILDGDNVRHGLNRDLGFTDQDRAENIRRIAEVSKLMTEAGLITLVSFISPFTAEREMARELIGAEKFAEVFVSTPLAVAEKRDVKGLYKKARAGIIPNFTGIGSPYEAPQHPDITLDTTAQTAEQLADMMIDWLEEKGFITKPL
jgi:bifunctional enzyme CysN/CysC